MKVKFIVRRHISFNGYSVNEYEVGGEYTATHGREEAFFARCIQEGHAEPVKESKQPETEALPDDHPAHDVKRKVKTPSRKK